MAGYNGWSMSNNAVAAYEDGEKPLSKWTKADIFDAIKEQEIELKCSIESLRKKGIGTRYGRIKYFKRNHIGNRA